VLTPGLLRLGGALARKGDSARAVLDAALSSPSGRGVIVDDEGAFLGTVDPQRLLAGLGRR
jgi:osmoprotectant transport system ATP-binding protein